MRPRFPISLIIIICTLVISGFILFTSDSFSFLFNPIFWAIIVIIAIGLFIYDGVSSLVENEKYKALTPVEKKAFLEERAKPFYKRLYDSAFGRQENVDENDLLLDHGYDGIQELDNKLPAWWLSLFYFGCFFLVFYIVAFSFTDFAHPLKELEKFDLKHNADVAKYLESVPQAKPEDMVFNPDYIQAGKKIYNDNCKKCHNEDGGATGNAGANLTDDYWRNINDPNLYANIVSVIWNGSKFDKTMVAFGAKNKILGNDIEKLAAYVYHLNQDTDAVNGKAPLGKVVKEWHKDPLPSNKNDIVDVFQYLGITDSLNQTPLP